MPTYEYECDACGHQFERFQKMGSDPVKTCPECKKRKVRRLIGSGAGIIFRGSGFYETDYRSANYQKREKEDSKSGSASETSSQRSGGSEKSSKSDKTPSSGSSSSGGDVKKSTDKKSGGGKSDS